MTDVSVIVVTYNARDWVRQCLAAVRNYPTELDLELVVIDNASDEITQSELREWAGPDAVLERQTENLGFGRACNRAVELSSGRHVLLLNPDALISAGTVEALLAKCQASPAVGIVGGRVTDPNGELDRGSCWGFQTTRSLLCFATGLSSAFPRSRLCNPEGLGSWERDTTRRVDVVTGCLLLTARDVWDQLDGFDARYFMYGEDADLCRRAADLGYEAWITPDAHIVHALGASSATTLRKQELLFRGKATLAIADGSGLKSRLDVGLLLTGVALRAAAERLTGQDRSAWLGLWRARAEWRNGWAAVRHDRSTHSTRGVGAATEVA